MRRAVRRLAWAVGLGLCVLGGCAREEPAPAASAAVLVEESAPAPRAAPVPKRLDRLQGRWTSTEDESFVIEVGGEEVTSWYDDERMSVERLAFVGDCEAMAPDPAGAYFILISDESGTLCYHLDELAADRLEYTFLPRGNTLSFTREE